jgi:hypothetical protein
VVVGFGQWELWACEKSVSLLKIFTNQKLPALHRNLWTAFEVWETEAEAAAACHRLSRAIHDGEFMPKLWFGEKGRNITWQAWGRMKRDV